MQPDELRTSREATPVEPQDDAPGGDGRGSERGSLKMLADELLEIACDLQDACKPRKARAREGISWTWAATMRKAGAAVQEAREALVAVEEKLNAPGTTPAELYRAERNAATLAEAAIIEARDLLLPTAPGREQSLRARGDCDYYEEFAAHRGENPGIADFYTTLLPAAWARARRPTAAVARWRTCTRARRGGGRPRRRRVTRANAPPGDSEGEPEPAGRARHSQGVLA